MQNNASILQFILEAKWALSKTDKDAVVMMHEIDYLLDGKNMLFKVVWY